MIVKEKGLLRLMKEAYRNSGYSVVVANVYGDEYLYVHRFGWKVGMDMRSVPRKILGMLAEHIGKIPACGEAYKVSKGAVQKEIFDVAVGSMKDLVQVLDNWTAHKQVKRTRIMWDSYQLWQCPEDQQMLMMDPDTLAIAAYETNNDLRMEGYEVLIRGSRSFAAVFRDRPRDGDSVMLDHMAQVQWTE